MWIAAAEIVEADGRARSLEQPSQRLGAWRGYPLALWEAARHRDSRVRARLEPLAANEEFAPAARQMAAAWSTVLQRSESALAAWRVAAPAAKEAASISTACDAVAAGERVSEEGRELAAAIDRTWWGEPCDVWSVVRRAWSTARAQGASAESALDAAMHAVEGHWGTARVRDVTALPRVASIPAYGCSSPAEWADREFQYLWRRYVSQSCQKLETAMRTAGGGGAVRHQLLLVTGWPLTRERDVDLAYLAQYEQVGPTVPCGGRRERSSWAPNHAVVLAVPGNAVRHATAHARAHGGRIVAGPRLPKGRENIERQALALLRLAFPYVASDAEEDVRASGVSLPVMQARAASREGRNAAWAQLEGDLDGVELYSALVRGGYRWIPDESLDEASTASAALTRVVALGLRDWTMSLSVECGRRPDTTLHTLYGAVRTFNTSTLGFSPTGGHPDMEIPLHRIISLTGDAQRRIPAEVPVHEPYVDPVPQA
ncbi:hypothetical protein OIE69_44190 (plasmid) [Actinacidiphila glaucinigra]|uniref:hypothetical protein n=1 Tax=Actinacidiphila glaucinigra TaxID=235986 RepID=UPI002DDC0671|nr:hypothetical protein [Actinacidiphila glaucinigra]WSD65905.1 hypothetical protein OIE69_44190 [Actinacidiphila glaucinigra]